MRDNNDANVFDVFNMMSDLINQGKGNYAVTCNDEYILAKKGDVAEVSESSKSVNLGGYDLKA